MDFGLSTRCYTGQTHCDVKGTPSYIAPEVSLVTVGGDRRLTVPYQVIGGHYGIPADLWSAGVVLFLTLAGEYPFYGNNPKEIEASIRSGKFSFDAAAWAELSPLARDLINLLLELDPGKRITAAEALRHPWITSEGEAHDAPLHSVVASLRSFNADQKFKKATLGLMANLTEAEELQKLREVFVQADRDKSGLLNATELEQVIERSGFEVSAEELIVLADMDGDGKLNLTEFMAASLSKVTYLNELHLQTVFAHLDQDGSGMINQQELENAFGGDDDIEGMIAEADTNKDGVVDFQEFCAMMSRTSNTRLTNALKKRRKGPRWRKRR